MDNSILRKKFFVDIIRKNYIKEKNSVFGDIDLKTIAEIRNDFYYKYDKILSVIYSDIYEAVKQLKEEEIQKLKFDIINEIEKKPIEY